MIEGLRATLARYARIAHTYRAWAGTLVPLAILVFVPIGIIHALPLHVEITNFDLDSGIKVFLLVTAVMALATTGLLGEVFYAGAVAIALTHPHDGEQPSTREIARMINYRRLIAVDLIFVLVVAAGLVLFFVPGLLAFIYLGLAAPVAEIEERTVWQSLKRSASLVRGHFWAVAAILVPVEIVSDVVTHFITELAHNRFSESFVAAWLTDAAANIIITPFYAIAAVLITIDLIAARNGERPDLNRPPAATEATPA